MLCYERVDTVTEDEGDHTQDSSDEVEEGCMSDDSGVYETDAEDLLDWADAEDGPATSAEDSAMMDTHVVVQVEDADVEAPNSAANLGAAEALCDGMNVLPKVAENIPSDAPWANREMAVRQLEQPHV